MLLFTDAAIMPCGHGGLCYRCGMVLSRQERKQQCPICRSNIEQLLKISKSELRDDQRVFVATQGLQLIKNDTSANAITTDVNRVNNAMEDAVSDSSAGELSIPLLRSIVPLSITGSNSSSPRVAPLTPLTPVIDTHTSGEFPVELELSILALQRESQTMIDLLSAANTTTNNTSATSAILEDGPSPVSATDQRPPSTVTEGKRGGGGGGGGGGGSGSSLYAESMA